MTAELDPLDAVIDRIRRSEPPAAGWPRARFARRRRRRMTLVALGVLTVAAAVYGLVNQPRGEQPVPLVQPREVAVAPNPPAPVPLPAPEPPPMPQPVPHSKDGVDPLPAGAAFGANPTPGGLQPPPRGRPAGVYASPRLAVAAAAPVIVSTGGAESIKLGGTVPAGTVGERVHVWNWEKSPDSRVLAATVKGAFTLTPDGATLVTADGRAIDLATGKADPLPWWGDGGLKLRPRWLRFSPDGKTLLAFETDEKVGTARLIDYPAGTERATVGGLWWATWSVGFSADGKTVALYGQDAHLRAFDATTGKEKQRFAPAFGNTIRAIAVSPDGSRVAGCYGKAVRVWDAATGRLVCEPKTEREEPDALAFSPDGTRLAGGGSDPLVLWDAADGKLVRRFPRESFLVGHVRFDAAGTTITTVKGFHIHGRPRGDEVTVYPTVDRWRVDGK